LVAELSLKAKTNPSGSELGVLGLDSLKANTNPSGLELKADIGPDDDWVLDDPVKAMTKPSGLELNTDRPALLLALASVDGNVRQVLDDVVRWRALTVVTKHSSKWSMLLVIGVTVMVPSIKYVSAPRVS